MAALKYSKVGNKTYVYIVENQTVIDDVTGKKKVIRTQLESLGVLNKDISKSQAKLALSRHMDKKQPLCSDLTLKSLIDEFRAHYKNQIGKSIKQGTYNLFEYKFR